MSLNHLWFTGWLLYKKLLWVDGAVSYITGWQIPFSTLLQLCRDQHPKSITLSLLSSVDDTDLGWANRNNLISCFSLVVRKRLYIVEHAIYRCIMGFSSILISFQYAFLFAVHSENIKWAGMDNFFNILFIFPTLIYALLCLEYFSTISYIPFPFFFSRIYREKGHSEEKT